MRHQRLHDYMGNPSLRWTLTSATVRAVPPSFRSALERYAKTLNGRATKIIASSIAALVIAKATYHVLRANEPFRKGLPFKHQPL